MPRKYGKGGNVRRIALAILISGLLFLVGCGGSGSGNGAGGNGGNGGGTNGGTSIAGGNTIVPLGAANVAPLTVNSFNGDVNIPYTTVQVCVPGTVSPGTANPNCVTIDHIMIDTGSTGLRIPASLLSGLNLANVNPGTPVTECYSFLSGTFFWGSVRSADVYMGGTSNTGEKAAGVPIHVIGDQPANSAPSDCTDNGLTEDDTAFGTHGFVGVGNFQYDCDALGYSNSCTASNTAPPGMYYTCSGGVCSIPSVSLAEQVRNPVSLFQTDNNGVIVELPTVASTGQTGITSGASLVFGIGTQTNNGLSSGATVLTLDANPNDPAWAGVATQFNGTTYPNSGEASTLVQNNYCVDDSACTFGSFFDTGSNGIFFLDQQQSGILDCGDWYCPNSTATPTATNVATGGSTSGNSRAVQFSVADANTLFSNNGGENFAFSDLAGPNTSGTNLGAVTEAEDGYFDWGLPTFYGRNVYVGIWGVTPPNGVTAGPFWAY